MNSQEITNKVNHWVVVKRQKAKITISLYNMIGILEFVICFTMHMRPHKKKVNNNFIIQINALE